MRQNRNSVKFTDCRWLAIRSGGPHGRRGHGNSQLQRYPNVPGQELRRATQSAFAEAWTELRIWRLDRHRLGNGGSDGILTKEGGKRKRKEQDGYAEGIVGRVRKWASRSAVNC